MISIQDNATYVEYISAQEDGYKASATLDFNGTNPSDGNTITFNGTVFTFKDSAANDNDVQIGSDISATLDNLLANPNLPSDVTYTKIDTDTLFIEYNVIGDSGNNWTIDCDFVSLPSGLSGGSNVPDADWVKAVNTTFTGHPREIPLAPDTDTSSINSFRSFSSVSGSKFVEGAKVLAIDSANNIESLTLGSISTSGSYDTLDPNNIGAKITLDSTTNLIATRNSDSNTNVDSQVYGLQINEGNRYWEVIGEQSIVGISTDNTYQDNYFAYVSTGYGYNADGTKYNNNTQVAYGDNYTNTDIIGIRYCYETGELEFYKNGISQGIAYILDANTVVYPAISLPNASTTATLITDESKLEYLPEECRPLGDLEFKSTVNASNNPVKVFFDDDIYVGIDIEPTSDRIINTPLEPLYIHPDTVDSGSNLVTLNSVAEGEEIVVNGIEASTGSITNSSTINTLDILNDGSCIVTYTFDDSTANCLDSAYNGTWEQDSSGNGPAYDIGMFGGKAAKISSQHDYIDASNPSELNDNNIVTFSFWINFTDYANYDGRLIGIQEVGASTSGISIWKNRISSGGGGNFIESALFDDDFIQNNTWYHYVCISDGSNGTKIYVNGELKVKDKTELYNITSNDDIFINRDSSYNKTEILIDQIRIFNRPLTEVEIQALYYEQKQTIELSNHGLTSRPVTAYKKQGIDLIFDSSTLSQFVGTVYTVKQLLESGDNIILDNSKIVTVNSITDSLTNTVNTLDVLNDNSCVATYTFDDSTANDLSGDYDGQWKDSSGNDTDGSYVSGIFDGKAASFDGTTYILNETKILNNLSSDSFSISLWFYANKINYANMIRLFGGMASSNSKETACKIDTDNKIVFTNCNGNSSVKVVSNTTIEANKWYHVVCVSNDSSKNYIYINKVLDNEGDFKDLDRSSYDWDETFGYNPNQSSSYDYFDGLIDQVRIFDKVLTKDEIQTIYNEQVQKYTITFDSQANAPKSLKIPDRSKTLSTVSKTFDGINFNYVYHDYEKKGRRFQRKVYTSKQGSVINPPLQTNMYKES